jgi:RNA polymerase sigma-70 factor, ECF subfamily
VLPIDYGPASDPHDALDQPLIESVWIDPYPDREQGLADGLATPEARYEQRESVELAFIAALQHLPVRQRAVLILRDVLGLSAAEVAEVLETTTTSVHSALQRAHKTVDARRPEQSQQAALRALGDARLQRVVDRYVEAWERGDVDAVTAMLADDAILAMPPIPNWYAGRAAVAEFLAAWPLAGRRRWRLLEVRANGQVAFAHYMSDDTPGRFTAHSINVLTLDGERVSSMTVFMEPEMFARFGLAAELDG